MIYTCDWSTMIKPLVRKPEELGWEIELKKAA